MLPTLIHTRKKKVRQSTNSIVLLLLLLLPLAPQMICHPPPILPLPIHHLRPLRPLCPLRPLRPLLLQLVQTRHPTMIADLALQPFLQRPTQAQGKEGIIPTRK